MNELLKNLDHLLLFGLPLTLWLSMAGIALASYLLLLGLFKGLSTILQRFTNASGNPNDLRYALLSSTTNRLLLALAALLIGAEFIDLPRKWELRIDHGWFMLISIQLALWLDRAAKLTRWRIDQDGDNGTDTQPITATIMIVLVRALIWSTALLLVLANIGVNITAFIASLGIGGVAVALALQNILSDLFASLSISLDKPFLVGDFIVFGDKLGTVEAIGLKTTRLRALSGEQIVISNTELLKQTIHNHKRMHQRRVVFGFGLSYDTPRKSIDTVTAKIREIIETVPQTRFDRAHFKGFGLDALEFEVVYFVLDPEFNVYMDIQQRINLELIALMEVQGITFAHPIRKILIEHNERISPSTKRGI